MCKMTVEEVGDMLQLSWQTATDWGHGIKMHGALMNRKSKARATILSCVDILQEKWSQSIYCPPNKIKLNNKATHVIYYKVCLLHKQKYLLPGSLLPAEVPSLGRWVKKTPNQCLHEREDWCWGRACICGLHWAPAQLQYGQNTWHKTEPIRLLPLPIAPAQLLYPTRRW